MAFVSPDGSPMVALVVGTGPKARSLVMFERMHELGLRTVIVADTRSWVHELETRGIVDKVIVVRGLGRLPQQRDLASSVVKALRRASILQVDGVYNAYSKFLQLSALVAERLGCITNSFESVSRCVFKDQTRECLLGAGLEAWTSFPCASVEDLERATAKVSYPAILKPAKGSGAVDVVKVWSPQEAVMVYAGLVTKRKVKNEVFLLEEFVDGPELGVQIVMQGGSVLFCSVMEVAKQATGPYFRGVGRSFPPSHGMLVDSYVKTHCVAAVQALGLTTGVFDLDVRYSLQSGVRVLDVNACMGGGSVHKMHELVYGIDLLEMDLRTSLGLSAADVADRQPTDPTACYEAGWVEAPVSGRVSGARVEAFTEELKTIFRQHPNILDFVPFCSDKDRVTGTNGTGLASTLVMVFVKASQRRFTEQYLASALCAAEERIEGLVLPSDATDTDSSPDAVSVEDAVAAFVSTAVLGAAVLMTQVLSPTSRGSHSTEFDKIFPQAD